MRPTEDASRFFVVVVEHLGWCPPGLGALCKLCTLHISIVHIVQTGPQGHFKVGPQRGRGSSLTQHIPLHMSSFDVTYTLVLQILFRHCLPPLVFPASPYHPFCPPPHFYPKRLTIEEYNKPNIIKRQTVTGSACHTTFKALFREKLARQGEVKEREQNIYLFIFCKEEAEVKWRWKKLVFRCRLKIVRDSAFRIGLGSLFHQPGTMNETVLESDFVPLCDGTTRRHSLADLRLLEGMYCHQWVEVGGCCWACGCSICKHQCLELDASCNREPVQGDKEGFKVQGSRELWHGPFWVRWRPIVLQHSESSLNVWLCVMEVQLEVHCNSPV